jgi:predicted anti-sigma-YlaC factor YlaD
MERSESGREKTCDSVRRLIDALLDGRMLDSLDKVRYHLAGCEACRRRYALDLALIEAIQGSPDAPAPGVAGQVVRVARAKMRRAALAKWGAVVGVVCVVGAASNLLGLRLFEYLLGVLLGGPTASPEVVAGSKVLSLLLGLAGTAKDVLVGGLVGVGAVPYSLGILTFVVCASMLVILMMYGMELWLRKPRGVKSWR